MSIPLPEGYFKLPPLKPEQIEALSRRARENANQVIDMLRLPDGPIAWEDAGVEDNVQLYSGRHRGGPGVPSKVTEGLYRMGATTIEARLDEVASIFDTSTTHKGKIYRVYDDVMADHHVLHTLIEPSAERPLHQRTVKWLVMQLPNKMIKLRDGVVIECQDTFTDPATGHRGWVKAYTSIDLPGFPNMYERFGIIRADAYHTGHMAIETDKPGHLKFMYMSLIYMNGNLNGSFDPGHRHFARVINNTQISKMVTMKRLSECRFLDDMEVVSKGSRSRCKVCESKFGLMTKKNNCRKCGEVVCDRCCKKWKLPSPRAHYILMRICAHCVAVTGSATYKNSDASTSQSYSNSLENTEVKTRTYLDADAKNPVQSVSLHENESNRSGSMHSYDSASRINTRRSGDRAPVHYNLYVKGGNASPHVSHEFTANQYSNEYEDENVRAPPPPLPYAADSMGANRIYRGDLPRPNRPAPDTASVSSSSSGQQYKYGQYATTEDVQKIYSGNHDNPTKSSGSTVFSDDASSQHSGGMHYNGESSGNHGYGKSMAKNSIAENAELDGIRRSMAGMEMDHVINAMRNSLHDSTTGPIPNSNADPQEYNMVQSDTSRTASVVQLYQQIVELTNELHELDLDPEKNMIRKVEVGKEMQNLYRRLNALTQGVPIV